MAAERLHKIGGKKHGKMKKSRFIKHQELILLMKEDDVRRGRIGT